MNYVCTVTRDYPTKYTRHILVRRFELFHNLLSDQFGRFACIWYKKLVHIGDNSVVILCCTIFESYQIGVAFPRSYFNDTRQRTLHDYVRCTLPLRDFSQYYKVTIGNQQLTETNERLTCNWINWMTTRLKLHTEKDSPIKHSPITEIAINLYFLAFKGM